MKKLVITIAQRIHEISRKVLHLLYLMPTHSYFRMLIQFQKIKNFQMIICLLKNHQEAKTQLEGRLWHLIQLTLNLRKSTKNSKRLKGIRQL